MYICIFQGRLDDEQTTNSGGAAIPNLNEIVASFRTNNKN